LSIAEEAGETTALTIGGAELFLRAEAGGLGPNISFMKDMFSVLKTLIIIMHHQQKTSQIYLAILKCMNILQPKYLIQYMNYVNFIV